MDDKIFFSIKTRDADTVASILNKEAGIEFTGINVMQEYLKVGEPVFIVLGGDRPSWDTGLVGIGTISQEPYDIGYEKRNFKIKIDMKVLLHQPIKREDLIPYRGTYGIIAIGPVLRGEPNQALTTMTEEQAVALMRAMAEINADIETDLCDLVGKDLSEKIFSMTKRMVEIPVKYKEELFQAIEKYVEEQRMFSEIEENRDNLMVAENQQFIFSAIKLLADNDCLNEEVLSILSNKELCVEKFKHHAFHGVMFEVDPEMEEDEQRKDANGYSRYYVEKYSHGGKEYFVSSEWRPDREDARKEFIDWVFDMIGTTINRPLNFYTGLDLQFQRNRIIFGAPGTGKSYTIDKEKNELLEKGGTYERVTFHPDYTYANFVGTYKPVPCADGITYEYVPGPFMRTLVKALKNGQEGEGKQKPHLLIIEEINRANVAAVFGDVFQLLDREENEVSEYPIQATEDMKKYLAKELKVPASVCEEIKIPDNMFIWATMNSADQGVFPMDTAFKRRWDFTYLGINSSEDGIAGKKVILGTGEYRRVVEWNALRKAINKELLKFKVNEDKLMGPYFISKKNLGEGTDIDAVRFTRIFKNKVLMYLFDDAAKQKRPSLFAGCEEKNLYSAICDEFDEKGVHIFCEDIYNKFIDVPEEG